MKPRTNPSNTLKPSQRARLKALIAAVEEDAAPNDPAFRHLLDYYKEIDKDLPWYAGVSWLLVFDMGDVSGERYSVSRALDALMTFADSSWPLTERDYYKDAGRTS